MLIVPRAHGPCPHPPPDRVQCGGARMPQVYLIKDRSGEVIEVPEGENSVGRGPLLRVSRWIVIQIQENSKLVLIGARP